MSKPECTCPAWSNVADPDCPRHKEPVTAVDLNSLVMITRRSLTRRLRDLRYSASVGAPLPVADETESETAFLAAVNAWLDDYAQRLVVAVDTTTDMAAELKTLRDQRSAIRSFLGTNEGDR